MKKILLIIIASLCGILTVQTLSAQGNESLRDRLARRQAQQNNTNNAPQLSERARIRNIGQTKEMGNTRWVRGIYRFLDLEKGLNGSLYYPTTPTATRMNLFTLIMKQLAAGNITAYKWQLDGSEIFTADQQANIKDILDQFEIMYIEENGKYKVEDIDLPNNEVRGYYVKELWYFDHNNSVFDVQTVAICPVLFRQDDYGEGTGRYPMFWLPYEEIKPYAAQMPVMTSNLNNVERGTIDDFFVMHRFDGEIYKTTNMRNMSMAELYPDQAVRKREEKKVEWELRAINDSLWVYNDSIAAVRALERQNSKGGKGASDSTQKTAVKKTARPQNSSPVRSMRDRKRN